MSVKLYAVLGKKGYKHIGFRNEEELIYFRIPDTLKPGDVDFLVEISLKKESDFSFGDFEEVLNDAFSENEIPKNQRKFYNTKGGTVEIILGIDSLSSKEAIIPFLKNAVDSLSRFGKEIKI